MKGAFSIKAKKTPYQRHKELEEERKRKADEEAAKVYEEFVESFKADEDEQSGAGVKAFVRGGTVTPGSRSHEASGQKGTKYVPSFMPPPLGGSAAGGAAAGKRPEPGRVHQRHDAFADDEEDDEFVFKLPTKKPEKDKPKQIDRMLEQLKREQEEREERERLRREGKPLPPERPSFLSPDDDDISAGRGFSGGYGDRGSLDEGDPHTTNLYVGNIHPEVNEAHLAREFGRFGPIGSVKIMWPRDEEQRRRGRNCGFVAFMQRAEAEAALKALDGLVLHGMEMKIGWGKAVPLPPVPLYSGQGVPTGPLTAIVPPAVTRDKGNPLTLAMQSALVPAQGMFAKESTQSRTVIKGVGRDVEVRIPDDPKQRFLIDSLALYVLKDGCEFEQLIMMEHQKLPEFAFLFDLDSPEHAYYRWRLYSLAEGDTLRTWRIDPYIMVEGGQAWLPPPMLAADIAAGTKRQETVRGQIGVLLSDHDRDRFEDMLRALTAERETIAEAMLFALGNADAATDVVEVLEEALTLPETPPATKLARLFLVNDILHNSTAPVRNASRYRARLEACLPEVFVSFHGTYKSADSRMVQDALRRAVLRLLRVWRERFIFNDDYLNGLQATFLGHIPILEQEEEKEQQQIQQQEQQQQPQQAGSDGSTQPTPASRWEAVDAEESEQQHQQQQQSAARNHHQQQTKTPARAQLRRLNPILESELDAMADEELERRCRSNGLSNKGSRQLLVERLLALDYYLNAEHRPAGGVGMLGLAGRASGSTGSGGLPAAAPAAESARLNRWQSADTMAATEGTAGDSLQTAGRGRWSGTISLSLKEEPQDSVHVGQPVNGLEQGQQSLAAGDSRAGILQQQQQQSGGLTPPAGVVAASRWQEVDEDAEKEAQPQVPVSKWLLEEAEAQRKAEEAQRQQEEASAAAAAAAREAAARAAIAAASARSSAAAGPSADTPTAAAGGSSGLGTPRGAAAVLAAAAAGGGGIPLTAAAGGAAKTAEELALEEERRKRLRQIELQVMDQRDDLLDKETPQAEAEAVADALRQRLIAELDTELAAQQQAVTAAAARNSSKAAAGRDNASGLRRGPADKTSSKEQDKSSNNACNEHVSRDRDRRQSDRQEREPDRQKEKVREREVKGRADKKRNRSISCSRSRSTSRSRSRNKQQGRTETGRDKGHAVGGSSSSRQQSGRGGPERPLEHRQELGNKASSSGRNRDKDRQPQRDSSRDKDRDRDHNRDKGRLDSKRSKRSRSRSRSRSLNSSRGGTKGLRRGPRDRSRSESRDRDRHRDRHGGVSSAKDSSRRHRS